MCIRTRCWPDWLCSLVKWIKWNLNRAVKYVAKRNARKDQYSTGKVNVLVYIANLMPTQEWLMSKEGPVESLAVRQPAVSTGKERNLYIAKFIVIQWWLMLHRKSAKWKTVQRAQVSITQNRRILWDAQLINYLVWLQPEEKNVWKQLVINIRLSTLKANHQVCIASPTVKVEW